MTFLYSCKPTEELISSVCCKMRKVAKHGKDGGEPEHGESSLSVFLYHYLFQN
jgi:hypothetical protein